MEFLSCTNTDTKENGLIGVSKDRVSLTAEDLLACTISHVPRVVFVCYIICAQIVFLPHKKKKNFCWDIETLVQWKQV